MLSEKKIACFHEQGYVVADGLFSPAEIAFFKRTLRSHAVTGND